MNELYAILLGFGIGLGVGGISMWAALRFYAWRDYIP